MISEWTTLMNNELKEALAGFKTAAEPIYCEPYGSGHINATYVCRLPGGRRYILQKINHNTFKDVPKLMHNIAAVTSHMANKQSSMQTLTLVETLDGGSYLKNDAGYWRMYGFVENSLCLQLPESNGDFYESALAFGAFQQLLSDFPAERLYETIPDFHNTPDRYRKFREAITSDPLNRAKDVRREIDFALSREREMGMLQGLRDSGKLPVRVTHNDTKLNNVLFDKNTRKALCVIDLDTVMPGLSAYDFGDAIRFGATTALEDERELSKVAFRQDRYEAFAEGYIRACPGLTEAELETLPLGAKTMTIENGIRFLTDHILGDVYFSVHREGHNLDRCRTQFALASDMEKNWDKMRKAVEEVKCAF